jgi:hypothetical protein
MQRKAEKADTVEKAVFAEQQKISDFFPLCRKFDFLHL